MITYTYDHYTIMINALYAPESSGIILPPTAIVTQRKHVYIKWMMVKCFINHIRILTSL